MAFRFLSIIFLLVINLLGPVVFASEAITYKQGEVHPNNYGPREGANPTILHILYTGESLKEALKTFKNPKEGVSVHYLISEDGRSVYRLVPESESAFHAGRSNWGEIHGVNKHSIGIALVNPGISHKAAIQEGWKNHFPEYSKAQIETLIRLSKDIIKRWDIKPWNVVGHSDISVQRKFDPGLSFPWDLLAKNGIGLWPTQQKDGGLMKIQDRCFFKKLEQYGYAIPKHAETDAVLAFQAHFRPSKVDGVIDAETNCILHELLEMKQKHLAESK